MTQTTYTVFYPTGDVFRVRDADKAEQWSKTGCEVKAVTHS